MVKEKMKSFRFRGQVVEIPNALGQWTPLVKLPDDVDLSLELPNDMFIFRTDMAGENTDARNVFCVDKLGKILWQIEKAASAPDPFYPNEPNPYNSIVWKNGALYALTQFGDEYIVDMKTGKIKFHRFCK